MSLDESIFEYHQEAVQNQTCKHTTASHRGLLDRLNLVNRSTQTVNLSSCLGVHVPGTMAIIAEEAPAFMAATA